MPSTARTRSPHRGNATGPASMLPGSRLDDPETHDDGAGAHHHDDDDDDERGNDPGDPDDGTRRVEQPTKSAQRESEGTGSEPAPDENGSHISRKRRSALVRVYTHPLSAVCCLLSAS